MTILLFILFSTIYAVGQKTPEDLGKITFHHFKNHQLDSFFRLIPTVPNLTELGKKYGIDSTSIRFHDFKRRYQLVIQNFKEKCNEIYRDTSDNHLSWHFATIDTIKVSTDSLPLYDNTTSERSITITIVNIYITSKRKQFKLTLADVASYDGIWKPGNTIYLTSL